MDPMDPEHWIEYCLITIRKMLEINLMNCPWAACVSFKFQTKVFEVPALLLPLPSHRFWLTLPNNVK